MLSFGMKKKVVYCNRMYQQSSEHHVSTHMTTCALDTNCVRPVDQLLNSLTLQSSRSWIYSFWNIYSRYRFYWSELCQWPAILTNAHAYIDIGGEKAMVIFLHIRLIVNIKQTLYRYIGASLYRIENNTLTIIGERTNESSVFCQLCHINYIHTHTDVRTSPSTSWTISDSHVDKIPCKSSIVFTA